MSTAIVRELDLEKLILKAGGHRPDGEFCVMEAVAFVAGEDWSDSPKCASKPIASIMRRLNDAMSDDERQVLKPYVVRLVGTAASDEIEEQRRWLATDWCVHVAAVRAFRQIGLAEWVAKLEQLAPVVDRKSYEAARPVLNSAAEGAYKFRSERRAKLESELRNLLVGKLPSVVAVVVAAADSAFLEKLAAIYAEKGYSATYYLARDYYREHLPEVLKDYRADLFKSALGLVDRMIALQPVAA